MIYLFSLLINLTSPTFGADTFPICQRPTDFSENKLVTSYEDCVKRRMRFCDHHEKLKECQKTKESQINLAKPTTTTKEPDPIDRCSIQKDGSYKCVQDAIRFIIPGQPPAGSAPSALSISTEDNPTGSPAPGSPATPGTAPAIGAAPGSALPAPPSPK